MVPWAALGASQRRLRGRRRGRVSTARRRTTTMVTVTMVMIKTMMTTMPGHAHALKSNGCATALDGEQRPRRGATRHTAPRRARAAGAAPTRRPSEI
jgi:hypothetical protein